MVSGSLEKKLASYALAGGAAMLAGGQTAEAAVVITVLDTPLVASVATGGGIQSLDIDLDGDSLVDFRFTAYSYTAEGELAVTQSDSVGVQGINGGLITGTGDLATLFGDSASALASNPTLNKAKLLSRYNDGYNNSQPVFDTFYNGNWQQGEFGTLGVKFMLGGVTPVMGFIDAKVDFGSATVTINRYGYDTPDAPEVPEPGTVSLLALGAAGVAALRRRRAAQ